MSFAEVGTEIQVNTTTANTQRLSAISALDGGGFVITWTNFVEVGPGDSNVYGQIFSSDGAKAGGEFLVNTAAPFAKSSTGAVTGLAGGGFAVVWNEYPPLGDSNGTGLRCQIFNAAGAKLGGEFQVNTTILNDQLVQPGTMSALAGGGFVVTWIDRSGSFDDAVRGQIFDSAGAMVGGEFLVNDARQGDQFANSVTGLTDGRFVATWRDDGTNGDDPNGGAVRGQIFLADGTKSGGQFLVNTTTAGPQFDSAVTALSGGRFAVTWTDNSQMGADKLGSSIRGQIFAADGTKSGGEFQVNTNAGGYQQDSVLTELADGRLLVIWNEQPGFGGWGKIHAQLFSDTGLKSGEEFVIAPASGGDQIFNGVTALDDGKFVVTWTDVAVSVNNIVIDDVRAQIFDPTQYFGTSANDSYYGGNFADTIFGGAGDDTLFGGAGDDIFYAGPGNDWMNGGAGSDTLDFSGADSGLYIDLRVATQTGYGTDNISGFENIIGSNLDDILTGNDLANDLTASEGADQLYGLAGADTLRGGNGDDYINAGDGNDTVFGGDGNDVISGGAGGTDTLNGEAGADFITGGGGVDIIDGGAGDDIWLGGDAGDDVITGGAGLDRIDGGAGNDNLTGGLGRDYLSGGLGADRFVFNVADFQAFIIDTVGDFHSVPGTEFDALRLQGSAGDYSFSDVNGAARIEHIATLGVIYVYNFTVAQLEDQTEYFV